MAKIIQVLDSFYPDTIAGTETYVLNVSKFLRKYGHDVAIIAPSVNGDNRYVFEGIPVYRYKIDTVASKDEYKAISPPKGLDAFESIINELNPDIVHFNTFGRAINIHHMKAAKKIGAKSYFTPHVSGVFCINSTLIDCEGRQCDGIVKNHDCLRCFLKTNQFPGIKSSMCILSQQLVGHCGALDKLLPAPAFLKYNRLKEFKELNVVADRVIAISPWIESFLHSNGVMNTSLVRQGVTEDVMHDPTALDYPEGGPLRLIFVGRIYYQKCPDLLCEAIEKIDASKVQLTIACICPDDDFAQSLKKRFTKLPNVRWMEGVCKEELGGLIRENDFLILPSQSEMAPLATLESFANGVPVITTDIPPFIDQVKDGENGVIFHVHSLEQLIEIILRLQASTKERRRLKANVKPPRTFADVAKDLNNIYMDKE